VRNHKKLCALRACACTFVCVYVCVCVCVCVCVREREREREHLNKAAFFKRHYSVDFVPLLIKVPLSTL